jgi:hypothetical protein
LVQQFQYPVEIVVVFVGDCDFAAAIGFTQEMDPGAEMAAQHIFDL